MEKELLWGHIRISKSKNTKNNNMMAFAQLEDLYGTIEMIVFPKIYEEYRELLKVDNIIIVEGRISIKEEESAKIICDRISPLKKTNTISFISK